MDGINKFELGELQNRSRGLRKQLDQVWDLLLRRGWWSYLTEFPLIDHDLIMAWITENGVRPMISIHYLFNEEHKLWEIILAYGDDVGLSFPYPPGRIQPETIKVNGDSHAGTD